MRPASSPTFRPVKLVGEIFTINQAKPRGKSGTRSDMQSTDALFKYLPQDRFAIMIKRVFICLVFH